MLQVKEIRPFIEEDDGALVIRQMKCLGDEAKKFLNELDKAVVAESEVRVKAYEAGLKKSS
jgi:hypothetical protein